jgi:hypothetical protein
VFEVNELSTIISVLVCADSCSSPQGFIVPFALWLGGDVIVVCCGEAHSAALHVCCEVRVPLTLPYFVFSLFSVFRKRKQK